MDCQATLSISVTQCDPTSATTEAKAIALADEVALLKWKTRLKISP